jgi:16S rRNA pseudouridine516 synthase
MLNVNPDDARRVTIELTEGRYHQARRMVAACGAHVESLNRVSFGALSLTDSTGELPLGDYRDASLADLLG